MPGPPNPVTNLPFLLSIADGYYCAYDFMPGNSGKNSVSLSVGCRHNPIAKSSNGTTGKKGPSSSKQQQQQRLSDDAIPLLAHLPLSQSQATAESSSIEEDEKRHRALLGLNPLLLSKASRTALLAPQHQLLQRLLNHLDHPRLEVRKEAAGCLRNLCVQGKWTGREQIWKLGGGVTALAQIEYAAGELGLLPRASKIEQTHQPQVPTDASAKKPEEMNRKERRHAAKAAAKAGSVVKRISKSARRLSDKCPKRYASISSKYSSIVG